MPDADTTDDRMATPALPPIDPAIRPDSTAIAVAYQYLCAETDDARTHRDLHKAHAAIQRGYTINADASVEVIGSDGSTIYVVHGGMCTIKGQFETSSQGRHRPTLCRGWKAAQRRTGACYHCWATEILRYAQALERGEL